MNEGVREKENSDRLEWIQTHVQCDGLAQTQFRRPRSGLTSGVRSPWLRWYAYLENTPAHLDNTQGSGNSGFPVRTS